MKEHLMKILKIMRVREFRKIELTLNYETVVSNYKVEKDNYKEVKKALSEYDKEIHSYNITFSEEKGSYDHDNYDPLWRKVNYIFYGKTERHQFDIYYISNYKIIERLQHLLGYHIMFEHNGIDGNIYEEKDLNLVVDYLLDISRLNSKSAEKMYNLIQTGKAFLKELPELSEEDR